MAEEVGLLVRVRTLAATGQLNKLRDDVNGAVQQGAQKAFSAPVKSGGFFKNIMADMKRNFALPSTASKGSGSVLDPKPIKGMPMDFRTKYDPAKGFAEKAAAKASPAPQDAPIKDYIKDLDAAIKEQRDAVRVQELQRKHGTTDIATIAAGEAGGKKGGLMGPMSGILGGGGGAAGGAGAMLGPLAALTIVGQGMFDMLQKMVGILAQASPALGGALKLIQKTLMMFLRPIGDLLAAFLRPIARFLLEANRKARQEALKVGRPGSISYTAMYMGTYILEIVKGIADAVAAALEWLLDSLFGKGTFQKIKEFFEKFDAAVLDTIKGVLDIISTAIGEIKNAVDKIANLLGIDTGAPTTSIPGDRFSDSTKEKYASGDWLGAALQDTYEMIFKRQWFPWFASGGYVPATPGGRIIGVAEGGEGEWIVPDSDKRNFARSVLGGGGGGTVINHLYLQGSVFGVDDLDRRVKRLMDASARESRRR